MSSNILVRVASLLKARDKHLRHAAFRIFRLLLKQNNHNTHVQMMKHDVLKPILDLTIQESRRDNLLSCSCQEYFENMRRENMKDMIKFCMTKHEDEIRTLAKTPLGGQRFELLIQRWEMNNEPLPVESKSEKPVETRGWPEGRTLDAEEEDYFNADDEEEYVFVANQWPRSAGESSPMAASNNALKRKRRLAMGSGPKGYRPPLRVPILGSLVDYGDEEEEEEGTISITKPGPSQTTPRSLGSPSPEITPASPKPSHRQVYTHSSTGPPPRRVSKDEDDEDNLLESLVRPKTRSQSPAPGPRPQSPGPGLMASISSIGLIRPGEKRRRGDDDDDELMERLTKAKKPDVGTKKEKAGFGSIGRTKNGDDPPKKIKVKFGTGSLAVASSPTSSETGAKDGDTG